ncbi:MAG: right-handed parallel beta-helix repeat-containing protein [Phycisphaerales bacterium]|nr:right-handed parallel beta-helix repeat-containing protein [Phycisphaerales bacterium]
MIRLNVMATCLVLTGIAGADTLQVPSDYPTIGDAIAAAQQGDTIAIAAGTYFESDLFIADADITITGDVFPDGSPAVKIDGESTNNILLAIGLAGATGATVENLIFTGSTGNALWIYHHSPTIRNCTFVENVSEFQGAAVWSSSTEAIFEDCRFIGNVAEANGNIVHTKGVTGLGSGDNGSPTFRDCLFENNSGSSILLSLYWDARLEDCDFQNNAAASILQTYQGSMTLLNTLICENQGDPINGDWIDEGGNFLGEVCPADCMGDFNGDQTIGVDDLLSLLEAYLVNADGDCDGDDDTDVDDLLLLIGVFGQNC